MKKIKYILIGMLFMSASSVMGQNLVDGLRYSDYRIQGTARSAAMGNAFGALGGDFTSASINPAGLGIYRSGEFVFTPSFGKTNVDATYMGQLTNDSKYNLSVPNIGYVATFGNNGDMGKSMVSFNVGFGYNRMNDFNVRKMVEATGATSSMLDQFVLNADGKSYSNLDPYYEKLASYNGSTGANLIYFQDGDPNKIYAHDMQKFPYSDTLTNFPHNQRKSFSQKGSIDEYLISMAANFNYKFYLGATIGFQNVNYEESTSLHESDPNNAGTQQDIPYFNNYSFDTYLHTTGTGVNVKIGAIYKPTEELRLGVALHSPTFYRLHDNFDNSMYSSLTLDNGPQSFEAHSPIADYYYDLQTPMKAIFSAAYVFQKKAIVSLDYEYVDYSTIKLTNGGNNYDFFNENQDIKSAYKAVGNIHVGVEYRLTDGFSLRGGYESYPSPFNSYAFGSNQPNSGITNSTVSGGIGFRQGGFFFDAAYKHAMNDNYTEVYSGSDQAKFSATKDRLIMTFGFRF
ncbi:MAG TPA: outer membrane protein transport protein [Sunxiuqinia sp.]|nr:outer membrane protein transport protein [Sunxiuqinia sp.]